MRRTARWIPIAMLALAGWRLAQTSSREGPFRFDPQRDYRVVRVIDGDTLLMQGDHRVRLLGVNTPETSHPDRPIEPFGPEAAEFTRSFVGAGRVRLRFDRERIDSFGRILAFVDTDNGCLNEELIRVGLSRAETGFPYSETMKRRLRECESEARAAGRGIWSAPATERAEKLSSKSGGRGGSDVRSETPER